MREPAPEARGGLVRIDFIELLLVYLRKWWLIVLCALVAGGLALLYTKTQVEPVYQAGVSVYVNNARNNEQSDYVSGTDLSTSKMLVNTYVNIISSDTVLGKVIEAAQLDYTPDQLRSILSARQVGDTEIFKVYINHTDPQECARIANAVANIAPGEIELFVEGSSCKIIDYATVPTTPIGPNYSRNAALGALLGCVAVLAFLTLRHTMDTRIKTEADLEFLGSIPVLGQIPSFSQPTKGRGYQGERLNPSPCQSGSTNHKEAR